MSHFLMRCVAACFFAFPVITVDAGETSGSDFHWKPRVTSVTVFKNGLGFFTREGSVRLQDGWCYSEAVPPATFGTLAIYSLDEGAVVDIVGSGPGERTDFDDIDAPSDSDAKRTRLERYLHMKVQLSYSDLGSVRRAAGTLVSIGPEYGILRSDQGTFAVPIGGVSRVELLEKPLRIHVDVGDAAPRDELALGMAYLTKGIAWIPEYTLTLIDEDTASLTLRGTLVNEAEDLVHCDVNFVVGVPHFMHTEYLAPIAVGQVIRSIAAAIAPDAVLSQSMSQRAFIASDVRGDQFNIVDRPSDTQGRHLREMTDHLSLWEGYGATDFTVYTRKGLTLRKGEKAVVTLFSRTVRYEDIYRWTPPAELRHYLVLHNDTDTAWTTGPCLVLSGGNALSVDLLQYVPRGGTAEVPVTTAINIAHQQTEAEIDRTLKAHSIANNVFVDHVTLEGVVRLRNFGTTSAHLVVRLPLVGKPLSASDDGTLGFHTKELKLLDRTGAISWDLRLAPGESRTLTYQYERYVHSR